MRPPEILYLAGSLFPPGGIQTLSTTCLRAFRELEDEKLLKYQCIVRRGPAPEDLRCLTAHDSGLAMQLKVARAWMLQRTNLVFSDHLYTARFASRLRAKHIFWAHLIEFDPPLHPIHQRSLASSHRIICDSHVTSRYIASLYPAVQTKLRVLHLGDVPRDPIPPAYELNLPNQQLSMIGRMAPEERYKGHDQVIEALPAVLQRFPGCQINLIGGGADRERLTTKAEQLGLSKHVRFLTNLDDETLFNNIKSSCGLLLPSVREAFGLVYLYAMWAGIPALAIRDTAGEEVLGECGIYAENQTSESLVQPICEMLSGNWKQSQASQLRYDQLFSYRAFKGRLASLFEEIL